MLRLLLLLRQMYGAAIVLILLGGIQGCDRKPKLDDASVRQFVLLKRSQAVGLAQTNQMRIPSDWDRLFEAILADDWNRATNLYAQLQAHRENGPSLLEDFLTRHQEVSAKIGLSPPKPAAVMGVPWHALVDAHWNYVLSKIWHEPFLEMIVEGISNTLPAGSVFIGDTDVGRFAMSRTFQACTVGKQPLLITQNQLADWSYLDYVKALHGTNLVIPKEEDLQALLRQSLSGMYGTGQTAVIKINQELSRQVFVHNPHRAFYIEPSYFVPEWTQPYLLPRGPVFEIRREPLQKIHDSALQTDRLFWSNWCRVLIGDSIRPGMTVKELCDFVRKTYLDKNLAGFEGNAAYISDAVAQEWFAYARFRVAALYQWRCIQAVEVAEKQRMLDEALFAYQQSFALGPEVTMGYAELLAQIGRTEEARELLELMLELNRNLSKARTKLAELGNQSGSEF